MADITLQDLPLRTESKRPKRKPARPIQAAIKEWAETLPADLLQSIQATVDDLIFSSPRRWVVYPPMVLLPSGSFRDRWWAALQSPAVDPEHLELLWVIILEEVGNREGKGILTHLAINQPIPLKEGTDGDSEGAEADNILRTPSGLVMLYGDFGPALHPLHAPSEKDLSEAFWVRAKQNGIVQVWAPRYTMFSRGNVTEKQRLLDFHGRYREIESRAKTKAELKQETAVDLYAGIGYFVFSYVKMGMGRVLGWELNPWSVEGLRRGAIANGWPVKVVREGDELELGDEVITVILGDNRKAGDRIKALDSLKPISHVNCGLLPTSEPTWEMALRLLSGDGWLHLHHNVGVRDMMTRKSQMEEDFRRQLREEMDDDRQLRIEHMETVKSFAPGVYHMVFDVYVYSQS